MKRSLLLSLAAATFLCAGATRAAAQANLFADPVVAKGKGFEIKQSEVEEAFLKFKANAAGNGQAVPDTQRDEIEKRILERLVVVKVLGARANEADKAEAKKKADKFLEDTKKAAGSESAFNRQLLAMGLTEDEFKRDVVERALSEEVIDRELRPKVNLADAQVKKFYEDNPARFEQPELVKFQHLHISTVDPASRREVPVAEKTKRRETVDKALERAKKGENFQTLVAEYSDDVRTKERGGEYTVAKGTMEPAFAGIESAAFSMRIGQVSDVLTSAFGYHILKVTERVPSKKIPFAEVSDKIRDALKQQEVQKLLPDFIETAKKDAGVELLNQAKP